MRAPSTRTTPTAQALSRPMSAVSKSMATNEGPPPLSNIRPVYQSNNYASLFCYFDDDVEDLAVAAAVQRHVESDDLDAVLRVGVGADPRLERLPRLRRQFAHQPGGLDRQSRRRMGLDPVRLGPRAEVPDVDVDFHRLARADLHPVRLDPDPERIVVVG